MGDVAKRLGQVAAKSLESESANILKTATANKTSLSKALDGTLKRGHDMKTFGLGTLASMSDRERYARFTGSMYAVYQAMETELDASVSVSKPVATVWKPYGDILRRSERLEKDWLDVSPNQTLQDLADESSWSSATLAYVEGIREAGEHDRETKGARLLGHLYCRYFADLFGGQMLATPYRVALGLPVGTPRHYHFDFDKGSRRSLIEGVYGSINEAAEELTTDQQEQVVEEAMEAFRHNIHVYSEDGGLYRDSLKGGWNMITGMVINQFQSHKRSTA